MKSEELVFSLLLRHALSEKEKATEGLLPTMDVLYRGLILTQVNEPLQGYEHKNIIQAVQTQKNGYTIASLG